VLSIGTPGKDEGIALGALVDGCLDGRDFVAAVGVVSVEPVSQPVMLAVKEHIYRGELGTV
jgi:hypothetical protein